MEDTNIQYISQRLSLRKPQAESLKILANLASKLALQKNSSLEQELEIVRAEYPNTFQNFERNFPSICFSLATGVGKTRLMGAFISYLYLEKGIKNFFVLAPNLTIYNKLIDDLSNINSPKYVFRGIAAFAQLAPLIVTGDNYNEVSQKAEDAQGVTYSEIRINIFNISKINAETRSGKVSKIKRFSEYLGESYFEYLSNLPDLVLLMDESHRYRGDRGMEVLDELNPVLGLELTATPQVEQSSRSIKFQNVVFEYSLSRAMQDGYVKEPSVATRKDFDPKSYSAEDLDRVKLEDGLKIHQETKTALEIYAKNNDLKIVKPFVLVVAKDTNHATDLKNIIQSENFFDGKYIGKVLEVHSNQKGEEKDENIEALVQLEHPLNTYEIVIHVNMLKEGWDVTNLYTIIPLRSSASQTLTEQTIGRGLRLPYGKRVNDPVIDRLTIVAHDKYQAIIEEANKAGSIIRKENIIILNEEELEAKNKIIERSLSNIEEAIEQEKSQLRNEPDSEEKDKKLASVLIKETVLPVIKTALAQVSKIKTDENSLQKIQEKAFYRVKALTQVNSAQTQLFQELPDQELRVLVERITEPLYINFKENFINIPRIITQPKDAISVFHDFDLDFSYFYRYEPPTSEIWIKFLRSEYPNQEIEKINNNETNIYQKPEKVLVATLTDNAPEIDYDSQAELLFRLAEAVVNFYRSYITEESELYRTIEHYKKPITEEIYKQMQPHHEEKFLGFDTQLSTGASEIKEPDLWRNEKDTVHDFRETITPISSIPSKVFKGFRKSYHGKYKFHSKPEKDFAIILEDDREVLKWLRPASQQFNIYYSNHSRYEPDFVVETSNAKYLVEIKMDKQVETQEVKEKAKAAIEFCKNASEIDLDGKEWKYALIPHDVVILGNSFMPLVSKGYICRHD
jgi:type III restriction enzyme